MNRRAFIHAMTGPLAGAGPIGLLLLDVDKFKTINDVRGHAVGDRVLEALGGLLRRVLRSTDLAARWGGEEIVVALPSTDPISACIAAERVRSAVEALVVIDDDGAPVPVTVSGGVVIRRRDETLDALVTRADRAMYEAKHTGRNRIVSAGATDIPDLSEPEDADEISIFRPKPRAVA
jgi:diguanylate cyclase (GGDEF)-like protein